jgi:hypothetical protein
MAPIWLDKLNGLEILGRSKMGQTNSILIDSKTRTLYLESYIYL